MKLFDKWQKIILIGLGVSSFLMITFYIAMVMTATPVDNPDAIFHEYKFNYTLQLFYSTFFFVQLAFGAWFLARLITFKMRKKEALEEQQEY